MSVYPGAIDSDATLYVAKDNIQTKLIAAMAPGDTIAVVADPSGWAANMIATVEVEQMLVVSVLGNAITVTRNFNGTGAVAHAQGKLFSNFVDAAYQSAAKSAVIAIETTLGANLSNVNSGPVLVASKYNFSPQTPGGTLGIGANTITLTPVPLGVNGTDSGHYLLISGGTGTTEGALIIGGTAVSGGGSGTVIVTCVNTHSGAWTIKSASGGIAEAINAIGPTSAGYAGTGSNIGGGSVYAPPATYTIYGGPILVPSNVELYGMLGSTILSPGTIGINIVQTVPRSLYNRVHDLTFNLEGISCNGLVLMSSQLGRYWNLEFQGGSAIVGIDLLLTVSGSADTTYNCILNDFQNIHMEIATLTPIVLSGSNVGPAGVVTENTFRNLWVAGGGASTPLIDISKAADSNYWYNINFESGLADSGFSIGATGLALPGGAGGQYIDYVVATGPNSNNIVVVGANQNNVTVKKILNIGWNAPFFINSGCTNIAIEDYRFPSDGLGIWASGGVHFGDTQNPTYIATPSLGFMPANGLNSNIPNSQTTFLYLSSGATGAISIGGFTGGTDGRILYVFNGTAQQMTIVNEDASSTAANRIATLTGANIVLRAGISFATFIYSSVNSRWFVMSTN